jgi:hypothetical protein
MTEKEMIEFSQWMWSDALSHVGKGIVVYAVLLITYWGFIA